MGRRLVAWYRRSARDLPWRGTKDPYAVWVSETMLQQTTVGAVRERYVSFLRKFPDVRSLALAAEEDVLREVQGLGYYRRFRALKRAAADVLEKHEGRLPSDPDLLAELPGVGEYTVGAIRAIAFDQPAAAIDGNVVRVLTRLFAIPGDHARPSARRALADRVLEMLPNGEASAFTQALFDLGASVCTPRDPTCLVCPLRSDCRSLAAGEPERFPEKPARRDAVDVVCAAALIERDGRVFIERREDGASRMAGFWQLPEEWGPSLPEAEIALGRRVARLAGAPTVAFGEPIAEVRHTITHHRLRCILLAVRKVEGFPTSGPACRWVTPAELHAFGEPVTTITRKLLARRKA